MEVNALFAREPEFALNATGLAEALAASRDVKMELAREFTPASPIFIGCSLIRAICVGGGPITLRPSRERGVERCGNVSNQVLWLFKPDGQSQMPVLLEWCRVMFGAAAAFRANMYDQRLVMSE